jgi:hypothetical protein
VDAVPDQHPLELGRLLHELVVLVVGAELHHPFHAGPVVPGPVEHDDLTGRGQVRDVALEVPLGALPLAGLLQRDDAGAAGVEVLGEPLDGAALAGGVPALEQEHQALPAVLDPVLELEQLDLEQPLAPVVLLPGHPLRVRVRLPPGVHRPAVGPQQHRVVLVAVVDPQVRQLVEEFAGLDLGAQVDGRPRRRDGVLGHAASMTRRPDTATRRRPGSGLDSVGHPAAGPAVR